MVSLDQLQEVFRDVFDSDHIVLSRETNANDIAEWDSLTHIRLIISIEQEFAVQFDTTEVVDLKNVGMFLDLLNAKKYPCVS